MERGNGSVQFDPVERIRVLWADAPGARRTVLYVAAGLIARYLIDAIKVSSSQTLWSLVSTPLRVITFPISVERPVQIELVVELGIMWLGVASVESTVGRFPWWRFVPLIAVVGAFNWLVSLAFGGAFALPGPAGVGLLALGVGAGILRKHRLEPSLPLTASQTFFLVLVAWVLYASPSMRLALTFALVSIPFCYMSVGDLAWPDPEPTPRPFVSPAVVPAPPPVPADAAAVAASIPSAPAPRPAALSPSPAVPLPPPPAPTRTFDGKSWIEALRNSDGSRRVRVIAASLALVLTSHVLLARNLVPVSKTASVLAGNTMHRIAALACGNQTGTGFFVARGVIVTNAHVLCPSDQIDVFLAGGRKLPGQVVYRERGVDLAAIRVDSAHSMSPLRLGDTTKLRQGDTIYVLGNPLGLDFSISQGIVSSAHRNYEGHWLIQIDAPVNPGNSGGPVVNEFGEVVGVVRLSGKTDGIAFAIPINYVYRDSSPEFLSKLSPRSDDVVPEMEASARRLVGGADEK